MAIELSKRCDVSVSVKGVGVSYLDIDKPRFSYPWPVDGGSPTVFTSQPQTQSADDNGNTTFNVGVENYETLQWYKNGSPVSGANGLTFTSTDSKNGDEIYCVANGIQRSNSAFVVGGYDNVVIIGASIMAGAFGQDLNNPNQEATEYLNINGVNVYGFGWPGYFISNGALKVAEALAAFPDKTLFIIHLGGNNISGARPLAGRTQAQLDGFMDTIAEMTAVTESRKHDIIFANVSFRNYDETTVYSEEYGSRPYNEQFIVAQNNERFINTDGNSVLDFYTPIRNNYITYLSSDNVHLNNTGAEFMKKYPLDRIRYLFTDGIMPETEVDTLGDLPVTDNSENVLVNFGGNSSYTYKGLTLLASAINGSPQNIIKVGGAASNYSVSLTGTAIAETTGVSVARAYDGELLSDALSMSALRVQSGNTLFVEISGGTPLSTLNLGITGFNLTTPTVSEYFEVGNTTNKITYDCRWSIPPSNPANLLVTFDSQGKAVIGVKASGNYSFGVISALQVGYDSVVVSPPQFTTQIVDTTVDEGDSATFTVSATGATSFEWFVNGVSSGTDNTFTKTAALADNGSKLYCVATGAGGKTSSNTVTMTVEWAGALPVFTKQPLPFTTNENEYVTFSVTATGADSYQWYKNGVAVGTNSTTYKGLFSLADNGVEVWCSATNASGSVISNKVVVNVLQNLAGPSDTVIISFGDRAVNSTGGYTGMIMDATTDIYNGAEYPLVDVSGITTSYSIKMTVTDSGGTPKLLDNNTSGVTLNTQFNNKLLSNPVARTAVWYHANDVFKIKVTGLSVGQQFTVKMIASRVSTTNRWTNIVDVVNPANFATYQANLENLEQPVSITLMGDINGEAEFQLDNASGSTFTYPSGVEFVF